VTEIPYVRHPIQFPARYAHGPDSLPQPDVPRGALHEHDWNASSVFPANLRVAAALAERGYDFRLVLGDGGHDGNHDGVILPDALRWLWRPESDKDAASDQVSYGL